MKKIKHSSAIEETNRFMQKVYAWMFVALMISGGVAYYTAVTPWLTDMILGNGSVFYVLLVFELALVFLLALHMKKIPYLLGAFLFFVYSVATGLTLSVIFLVFTIESIWMVFMISACMFAVMSIYGYFTKTDLTSIGSILILGLIGIVIASAVNLFLKNTLVEFIISVVGVIVFVGLTAYDTQKIRKTNILGNEGTDEDRKEAIMGALTLYLDFVNLFIKLLRLFGKRRR